MCRNHFCPHTKENKAKETPFEELRQKFAHTTILDDTVDVATLKCQAFGLCRKIIFSRHGESEYNVENKIGGDSDLSEKGYLYAKELGRYFNTTEYQGIKIWTSSRKRTIATAANIDAEERKQFSCLDEINAGKYDGLSYDDVEALYPEEFKKRQMDKLNYRYPEGESYIDCCNRILPCLEELELERRQGENPLLIVAHQAILRCIFGYLLKCQPEEIPSMKIPQHALMQVTWIPNYDTSCKTGDNFPESSKHDENQNVMAPDEVCKIEYIQIPI